MSLPWVSREALRAAEERLNWTEKELRAAEEVIAATKAESLLLRVEYDRTKKALAEAEAERRRLTDRILRLSGQAPLYEAAEPASMVAAMVAASPDVKDLAKANALPVAGTTFNGVHSAARKAMADGTFDIAKARPRL